MNTQDCLTTGDLVEILTDQDGATDMIAIVGEVYRSGRCCVFLPVGGFRNLKPEQLRKYEMEPEVKTETSQQWTYETDVKDGVCIIARDKMQIKFKFESYGREFFDVLKIDSAIALRLKEPVSVEGMADFLHQTFPTLRVTASGRAESHGWITSIVGRK